MKLLKTLNIVVAVMLTICAIQAKPKAVPPSVGLYGGLNLNLHSPSFEYEFETSHVVFDENGSGVGATFGFTGLLPFDSVFVLSGYIGYNNMGGFLSKDINGGTYDLEASLNYIEISPVMQFHNVVPLDNFYLLAGVETGIPLSPRYSIKSDTAIKENKTVPDANFRMAGIAGAGYKLNIGEGINLFPELTFRLPFSEVSNDAIFDSWEVPQVRFGVSINFSLKKPEKEPVVEESELNVGFDEVNYYDKEGNKYPLGRARVEEVKYTEQFPLIPYVFFEKNKAKIGDELQVFSAQNQAGRFTINSLEPDAEEINVRILDIVGKRMEDNPRAKLTITGTVDGVEEKNQDLAMKRAVFAKKYLVDNYEISSDNIEVRATGTPEEPSTTKVPEGLSENRRIELSSSNPEIMEPIVIQNENQTVANPNLVEFIPDIYSTDSIVDWTLTITQEGEKIRTFNGDSVPSEIAWVIIPNELEKSELPIEYVLRAKNSVGLEESASGTIPIDYYSFTRKKSEDLPDKTVSKFSLILFDFDSDKISDKDMRIVNDYILPAVKFNSTVKIYGYTDEIGDDRYNKNLAKRRAETVRDLLKSKVETAKFQIYGIGESESIFNNESPIGRHLSRTVQVYVITPK